jgi:hypothetical protein
VPISKQVLSSAFLSSSRNNANASKGPAADAQLWH